MFLLQIEFQVLHHSYYYYSISASSSSLSNIKKCDCINIHLYTVHIKSFSAMLYAAHIPWSFRLAVTIALWLYWAFRYFFSLYPVFFVFHFRSLPFQFCNLYQCVSRKMVACTCSICIYLTCLGMFACFVQYVEKKKNTKN